MKHLFKSNTAKLVTWMRLVPHIRAVKNININITEEVLFLWRKWRPLSFWTMCHKDHTKAGVKIITSGKNKPYLPQM